jgi:hypothetical protein
VARADTPLGWHATDRGLKLVRSALLVRLAVALLSLCYAFFIVSRGDEPESGPYVLAVAYVAAMAFGVAGPGWLVTRASRGVVAAGLACAGQLVELSAVLLMLFGFITASTGTILFYAASIGFMFMLIATAFAAGAMAVGARRRDLGIGVEKVGWNLVVVTVLGLVGSFLGLLSPGLAVPILLIDTMYGLVVYVALILVVGKVRVAIQVAFPEPTRAIARLR